MTDAAAPAGPGNDECPRRSESIRFVVTAIYNDGRAPRSSGSKRPNPTRPGNPTSPACAWPTAPTWKSSPGSMTTPATCCTSPRTREITGKIVGQARSPQPQTSTACRVDPDRQRHRLHHPVRPQRRPNGAAPSTSSPGSGSPRRTARPHTANPGEDRTLPPNPETVDPATTRSDHDRRTERTADRFQTHLQPANARAGRCT